jgi:predicted Zn-dependent protease
MPTCIICHEEIELKADSNIKSYTCPNGHQVHKKCLQDWLIHSQVCPLCAEKYNPNIISEFTGYLNEIKKQEEQKKQKKAELELEKVISSVADEIVLLEQLEISKMLIKQKEFDKALKQLFNLSDHSSENVHVLYFIGKTFYLKEQYDLAINYFMKLVKKDYNYPKGFYYLGKSYQALGLDDKAKWAFDRISPEKQPS